MTPRISWQTLWQPAHCVYTPCMHTIKGSSHWFYRNEQYYSETVLAGRGNADTEEFSPRHHSVLISFADHHLYSEWFQCSQTASWLRALEQLSVLLLLWKEPHRETDVIINLPEASRKGRPTPVLWSINWLTLCVFMLEVNWRLKRRHTSLHILHIG